MIKVLNFEEEVELYHRINDLNGRQKWEKLLSGSEEQIDKVINNQCNFDPDLWVLVIDDPRGKNYLSEFDMIDKIYGIFFRFFIIYALRLYLVKIFLNILLYFQYELLQN